MVANAALETKHDRFLRLAQKRVERALEQLRLITQLSSHNYESTPQEAEEIVKVLDEHLRRIATTFGVEYASRIGKGASQTTGGASPIIGFKKAAILDEIEIVKALEHLRAGRTEEVDRVLRGSIIGQRAA